MGLFSVEYGAGDKRSCAAAMKNGVTYMHGKTKKTSPFFVPWLELPGASPDEQEVINTQR